MEPTQLLKVTANAVGLFNTTQIFFANMQKNGRIAIPKITMTLMAREKPVYQRYIMEVTLEPT